MALTHGGEMGWKAIVLALIALAASSRASLAQTPCVGPAAILPDSKQVATIWEKAREPCLTGRSSKLRAWRFTWSRTFHAPVVVRVEEVSGGSLQLIATQLGGTGGFGVGEAAERVDRRLTKDEAQHFLAVVGTDGAPEPVPRPCAGPLPCPPGADGADWFFEEASAARYRSVHHWSPEAGAGRRLGETYLALTGWPVDPIY